MKEYIEHTCGECIHSEICEQWPTRTGWGILNPVQCRMFRSAADVVERKRGQMRVEVETFDDYYREHFFCPFCDIEIGHKTWDEKYQFGQGTVLHSNKFPNFCPNCGADMREVDHA